MSGSGPCSRPTARRWRRTFSWMRSAYVWGPQTRRPLLLAGSVENTLFQEGDTHSAVHRRPERH
eukprot:24498-Prorocentrum_lima.AAC.1